MTACVLFAWAVATGNPTLYAVWEIRDGIAPAAATRTVTEPRAEVCGEPGETVALEVLGVRLGATWAERPVWGLRSERSAEVVLR